LRAIHIDHGLHQDSAGWARDCRDRAAQLGIDYQSVRIELAQDSGQSLEAIAREARYRAFAEQLCPGEMLLTAHHEEDQLETVLLRLLRGTGVKGMRGIAVSSEFATGYLGRPLLGVTRAEIAMAATQWELQWIQDPSNSNERFDRNYLRRVVVPTLHERWPAASRTVARAARQMADAQGLLDEIASTDATGIADTGRVSCEILLELAPARLRNLLRFIIDAHGLPLPTATQLDELTGALAITRRDAQTCVSWPGAEARIYGDFVYLMPPSADCSPPGALGCLEPDRPWIGPEGRLELRAADSADSRPALADACVGSGLTVWFRCGGERFIPAGGAHHRSVKKLLQEARVVPWMRSRIPLLFHDDQLVAVGDLWICDAARAEAGQGRSWHVYWDQHPALY
jgi:tRNA(Ile)-lysidine synthase